MNGLSAPGTKTEWGAYLDGAGGLGWHTTTLDNVNAYLQAIAFANYGLTGIGQSSWWKL